MKSINLGQGSDRLISDGGGGHCQCPDSRWVASYLWKVGILRPESNLKDLVHGTVGQTMMVQRVTVIVVVGEWAQVRV